MRELMKHHIFCVIDSARTAQGVVPCEDERAEARGGVAEVEVLAVLPDTVTDRLLATHHISAGIDQNRRQSRIVVRLAMQEQHACLRGDRYADLVGELQPAASLELFLCEEHLRVP